MNALENVQTLFLRNAILPKDEITFSVQVGVRRTDRYTYEACEVPTIFGGAPSIISVSH